MRVGSLVSATLLQLLLLSTAAAQNNVGIGTTTPDASALLDLTASDKGLLVPRLTDAQMLAVAAPATSLLVYNTTLNEFYYYDGTAWVPFLSAPGWLLTGNAGTTALNFLGTTDANPLAIRTDNLERMIVTSTGSVGIGTSAPVSKLDLGDGNLSLTNTTNTAGEIRWYEPSGSGTNYTAFLAGPMDADIVYTWPTNAPAAGQTLTAGPVPTQLQWSTVAGGAIDDTLWFVGAGTSSLVGRGNNNAAAGAYGIAAGYSNQANGNYSVAIGGNGNVASGLNATVSGGYLNQGSGNYATIGGGQNNLASSVNAFVGGGNVNQATAQYTAIPGGQSNTAAGNYSAILGGSNNSTTSLGTHATIAGGQTNAVRGSWTSILGGQNNQSDGSYASILGGASNTANGNYSSILGGQSNTTNTIYGIVGGYSNTLGSSAQYSTLLGANATLNQQNTVAFHHAGAAASLYGQTRVGIRTVTPTDALEVTNGNVILSNTSNAATAVRFNEPSGSGTSYSEFKARAQAANINYTWPDTAGRANDVLTNDGNGNLYWTNNILTGSFYLGSTTSATFQGDVNDFTLDANYTLHRISAANSQVDVSGFAGGVDGRVVILVNVGSQTMTILFESAFSQPENRIIGSGGNFSMQQNKAVSMVYDGISARWRIYAAYP